MRCPFCHDDHDKVIDSRSTDGGRITRRRRQCLTCDKRFTTYERVEESIRLTVVKRDGARVPYDRTKLLGGVQKAAYKRPIPAADLAAVVDEIEEQLAARPGREVPSMDIGLMVVEKLKRLDHVAYVRFASVYLKLENIDDLLSELEEVKQTTDPPPAADQQPLF
jgi:transcriptional repressor NrdR